MTDTTITSPNQEQPSNFNLPDSWEAMPYGEHWSFAYTTERGEREDYDFRVELHEGMAEAEERAVINLIETAPKLLEQLKLAIDVLEFQAIVNGDTGVYMDAIREGRAAIAKATGRVA